MEESVEQPAVILVVVVVVPLEAIGIILDKEEISG
jgi:hypothetical protein